MFSPLQFFKYMVCSYLTHILDIAPDSYASEYVKGRQLSNSLIETFQIGYNGGQTLEVMQRAGFSMESLVESGIAKHGKYGLYDRFQHRLIFPIHNAFGKLIGFGGRDLQDKSQAKYINSPNSDLFDKSRVLYGFHRVPAGSSEITLLEGYFDVIRMYERGNYVNPVAVLGTALTQEQIGLMVNSGIKRVNLALDNDWAGLVALARCVSLLEENGKLGYTIVSLTTHKDWDEALLAGTYKHNRESFLDSHWLMDQLREKLPGDLAVTQRKMVSSAIYPHIEHSRRLMENAQELLQLSQTAMRVAYKNKKNNRYFLQRGYQK